MNPASNIASYLSKMAESQPLTEAMIVATGKKAYTRLSYADLEESSNQLARGFLEYGITQGTRVVVMVKPGREFFSIVFALFKIGAVVVAIDPGMGFKRLGTCLEEAEPTVFIGVPLAHLARLLFRWARGSLALQIILGRRFMPGHIALDTVQSTGAQSRAGIAITTASEDMAAILFTSGSTGVPKGVVYTHGHFIAQVEMLKDTYGIQPGEIDLATFPLFALFAPALGMTSIIPDMDFTRPGHVKPENIVDPIIQFSATTMFASPALLDRVGQYGYDQGIQLSSLKRVLSAGAPVSNRILNGFQNLLDDGVNIFTPYGATESLPVCSIGSLEIISETAALSEQGHGTCVGKPVDNIDLRIIAIKDDAISRWDDSLEMQDSMIGEIAVKGPQVTAAYINRNESTRLAKIHCDDGSFFHRMGDLGYLDEQGRVWFCGRKSERVITVDGVLYTSQCEGVFNSHNDVKQTALAGVCQGRYERPVICVEMLNDVAEDGLIKDLLSIAQNFSHTRTIKDFLCHPGFPVDIRHNAKINRKALSDWSARHLH